MKERFDKMVGSSIYEKRKTRNRLLAKLKKDHTVFVLPVIDVYTRNMLNSLIQKNCCCQVYLS